MMGYPDKFGTAILAMVRRTTAPGMPNMFLTDEMRGPQDKPMFLAYLADDDIYYLLDEYFAMNHKAQVADVDTLDKWPTSGFIPTVTIDDQKFIVHIVSPVKSELSDDISEKLLQLAAEFCSDMGNILDADE